MKNTLACLIFAAAISGCVAMTPIVESRPVSLSASQRAQIESTVTTDFKDPGSAQFRNVRAADLTLEDGTKERRVCGEVNGKNSFGAYVGFTMFGGTIVNGRFVQNPFFGLCE
jgi:hypothetical protein